MVDREPEVGVELAPTARNMGLTKRRNILNKIAPTAVLGVHMSGTPGFVDPEVGVQLGALERDASQNAALERDAS